MIDVGFARPLCLLAALPLAWCWWSIWSRARKRGEDWHDVVDAHLMPHVLVEPGGPRRRAAGLALLALAWLLGVAALAGPILGQPMEAARAASSVQVFLIEVPDSVGLDDEARRRWEGVLQDGQKLIPLPPGYETAIVLYSRNPFLLIPPTVDRASPGRLLQNLSPGMLPAYGARPDLALAMAEDIRRRNRFDKADVVWLTAGDITAATPGVPTLEGRVSVLYYGTDPALARKLEDHARQMGGFFHAQGAGREIESIPGPFLPESSGQAGATQPVEYAPVLILLVLGGALLLLRPVGLLLLFAGVLSFEVVLADRSWAGEAAVADNQLRKTAQFGNRLLAVAAFVDPCWRAVAHYRLAHYPEAAALWAECPGADAAYNRGNALARSGRLDDALAAYNQALQLRPDDAEFRFNRGVVQAILKPPSPPRPPSKAGGPSGASVPPESRELPSADPQTEKPMTVQRLAEKTERRAADNEREFLQRLILLQEQRRMPPAGRR